MPAYELLCLVRPTLPRDGLKSLLLKVGRAIQARGGVLTNVASYGEQQLAYRIKGVAGKFEQAQIWSMDFTLTPAALAEVNMQLRVNEDVLRHAVVKRPLLPPLPKPAAMYHNSEFGHLLRPPPRRQA